MIVLVREFLARVWLCVGAEGDVVGFLSAVFLFCFGMRCFNILQADVIGERVVWGARGVVSHRKIIFVIHVRS